MFEAIVYYRLKTLLDKLEERRVFGEPEEETAAAIHKEITLQSFFTKASNKQPERFINHTVCYTCLLETPEHVLPCGHIICTSCARSYGTLQDDYIEMNHCPMEAQPMPKSRRLRIKPEAAGVRILTLDG